MKASSVAAATLMGALLVSCEPQSRYAVLSTFFDGVPTPAPVISAAAVRPLNGPSAAQLESLRAEGLLKPGATLWYNAGIYIFLPSIFDFMARLEKSPRGEYEVTDAISAFILAQNRIAGVEIQGRWVDVRDPEVLAGLEQEQK